MGIQVRGIRLRKNKRGTRITTKLAITKEYEMKQKDYELLEGLYRDNINIHIKSALKKAIKLLKKNSIPVKLPVRRNNK